MLEEIDHGKTDAQGYWSMDGLVRPSIDVRASVAKWAKAETIFRNASG